MHQDSTLEIGLWKLSMNTIFKKVETILKNAEIEEYKAESKLIILEISKKKIEDLILDEKIENEEEIIKIANLRASTKMPIQHILGYSRFMGEKFVVNKNVLIPRDETEILVNCAFELLKNKKEKINILEIGIGSGCISCSLAKKLKDYEIEILGIDISLEALKTALFNISNLNLIKKVVVRKSDIFSKIREMEKFDLIISNPPYIPKNKKDELDFTVKNFEPEIALFAQDNEGIDFYKKIIKDAPKFLKKDGFIAFELGINQSRQVKKLLEKDFQNIKIEKDLAGIERVISASFIQ